MMPITIDAVRTVLARYGIEPPSTVVCAVSGGLDSMVLAHVLKRAGFNVHAVHINHSAQASSDDWARWVTERMQRLEVPVTVSRLAPIVGGNREERWRHARAEIFRDALAANGVLVTAHHLDDQAETLLLQLLRGAGSQGLQGMPERAYLDSTRQHVRPLLAYSRAALALYAKQHRVEWLEDPSNQDESFDRNFIRHSVLPLLETRWQAARTTLARSAALLSEANALAESLARVDIGEGAKVDRLDVSALLHLDDARFANAVRVWIRTLPERLPAQKRLLEALRQWREAGVDRMPSLDLEGGVVQRYRQQLVYVRHEAPPPDWFGEIRGPGSLDLPSSLGQLKLAVAASAASERGILLSSRAGHPVFTVRFRQGGERLRRASGQHQTLKQYLQEHAVPPAHRSRLPLLFIDGELVAVADRWVDARFRPGPHDPPKKVFVLSWLLDATEAAK
ncbi:MAG: tRNA lysidine(34) synthetase TilS [Pseudomonadota bacterium]